jgi:hypothetical protein
MAATMWAVKEFQLYVLGRHFKWFFSVKYPSSRLLRWRLKLEEHDITIHYRSGKTISHADVLPHSDNTKQMPVWTQRRGRFSRS